jgi:branched-chain amino acid transport system ATP-binding protein
MTTTSPALLSVDDVVAGFGATTVIHGLTFGVARGEIAGIFGLNGAGKSVSMKVLAGVVPARSGRITFDGHDITNLPAEERVANGMGHVPQGRQVFPELTVEENLRLGGYTLRRRNRSGWQPAIDAVYDRFPLLADRREQLAGTMSGGQQASLAVARALVSQPSLILVDEPSAGLAPVAVEGLFTTLKEVAKSGVTMVLVEQNIAFGLEVVDTAHILQTGRIVYSGDVGALDQSTLARYLGIGRMLGGATASALTSRRATPSSEIPEHWRRRREARAARRAAAAR